MKDVGFTRVFAVTADQRRSRHGPDLVPQALAALGRLPVRALLLPFERTAGDEVQGLVASASGVVAVVRELVRLAHWRIGIGLGDVEEPLPASTRAARGSAYLAAREALTAARATPVGVAVRDGRPGTLVDDPRQAVWQAESALLLWGQLLSRRSVEGWQVVDLLDRGLTNRAAAHELGISPSAASQRANRAAYAEGLRGALLATELLARAAEEGTP